MSTLTDARSTVRDIRRIAREAKAERRDGELELFAAYDAAAVKPPPRTLNPATGKARRDYSGGSWDWTRGRPQWQLRVLIGGPAAVYGPDELLDVLREAGVLSESDDLDTWADRVLSARTPRTLTPAEVATLSGHPAALVAQVLDGDLDDAAATFQRWEAEMAGSLREQYDALRAHQAEVAAEVAAFAERVRHERYDTGTSWADIARDLGVTRARALRLAHPQGAPRPDENRRPREATPTGQAETDSAHEPMDYSDTF